MDSKVVIEREKHTASSSVTDILFKFSSFNSDKMRFISKGLFLVLCCLGVGAASFNSYLEGLPSCVNSSTCTLTEGRCQFGNADRPVNSGNFFNKWNGIFNSTRFPCRGTILNVTVAIDNTEQQEDGIELQIWRLENNTYMLTNWTSTKIVDCAGCVKTPLVLRESLSFEKGDVLGISLDNNDIRFEYSTSASNFAIGTKPARSEVLFLATFDVNKIHRTAGQRLTLTQLHEYSPASSNGPIRYAQAYPLIELELQIGDGTPPPETTVTIGTSSGSLPTEDFIVTDPPSTVALINVAVGVVITMVILITLAAVIVAVLIGTVCGRRRRVPATAKVDPGEVELQDKGDCGNYDEIGRSFSGGIRSLGSSVASLTNGRYEVNQNYNYVPAVPSATALSSLVANGNGSGNGKINGTFTSPDYEHDYSAVGPAASNNGDYDIPDDYHPYDDIYEQPPSNEKDLYSQLAKHQYELIDRNYIEFVHCIGMGEFGTVSKGYWNSKGYRRKVAIKTLNPQAVDKDRIRFLQEAVIIAQFRHPNIVKLFGVVKDGDPKMIILELMDKGDMKSALVDLKPSPGEPPSKDLPILLLKFSRQVSNGMDYLAKKCFIHRDLAARNILVTEDYICKIGDFGMARDLAHDNCYLSSGGLVPVKWTAPEALNYGKFSTASDVWSFGALLYEIWSLGRKPFEEKDNQEVIKLIQTGYRLPPPPGCPRSVYATMISCWHSSAHLRPEFSDIHANLKQPLSSIFSWSEENKEMAGNPQATVLGAPISAGFGLYEDLQQTYTKREQ